MFNIDTTNSITAFRSPTNGAGVFQILNAAQSGVFVVDTNVPKITLPLSTALQVGGDSLFKTNTNSTTAFQVQNSSGTAIFAVDTTNSTVKVNGANVETINLVFVTFPNNATLATTLGESTAVCWSYWNAETLIPLPASADYSYGSGITFSNSTNAFTIGTTGLYRLSITANIVYQESNDYNVISMTVNGGAYQYFARGNVERDNLGHTYSAGRGTAYSYRVFKLTASDSVKFYTRNSDTTGYMLDGNICIERIA